MHLAVRLSFSREKLAFRHLATWFACAPSSSDSEGQRCEIRKHHGLEPMALEPAGPHAEKGHAPYFEGCIAAQGFKLFHGNEFDTSLYLFFLHCALAFLNGLVRYCSKHWLEAWARASPPTRKSAIEASAAACRINTTDRVAWLAAGWNEVLHFGAGLGSEAGF